MAPIFGHSGNVFDETASNLHLPWVTQVTKTKEIAEIYPPNVLPLEINSPNENRLRALIMQNGNLVRSGAQTKAFEDAFKKLELFVVIDVTMTETANFAHYILPAASQFEKWEATFFNLDFPVNYFHLRKPIFPPLGESQPESYIYQKLWEHLNPKSFKIPFLQMILKNRKYNSILGLASFIVHILINKIAKDNKVIFIYKAFEKVFDNSKIAVAPLWAISHLYFLKNRKAVKKVKINSGEELFEKILSNHSGLNISHHQYEDCWNMLGYKNKKIHLAIDELLNSSPKLQEIDPDYPLTLIAGERRSYNANTIFQNPDWRKSDQEGFLRIHPKNAAELGVGDGQTILCRSRTGEIKVITKICETMQYNLLSLPHGYGLSYKNENEPLHKFGPNINCLSNLYDCDPISKTPYYKQLQVRLEII
jgi:anaerobic selenocysteine-containing dehydrogenase